MVTKVWVNHDTDLMNLTIHANGKTSIIHSTQHHPFWNATRHAWIEADQLKPGEQLHTTNGTTATVASTTTIPGAADMWDLTITTTHNFYIATTTANILVHNCPNNSDGIHGRLNEESRGVDSEYVWAHGDRYLQVEEDRTRLVRVLPRGNGRNDVVIRELDGTPVTSMIISDNSLAGRIESGRWE